MAYCDVAYADAYITAGAFAGKWSGDNATKLKFIETATRFIRLYSYFLDEYGEPFRYSDTASDTIPVWLKEATCEEALYLITLGKDPTAADKKLTLGIQSTDGTVFSREFQADILCPACVRILEDNGAILESGSTAGPGADWNYFNK